VYPPPYLLSLPCPLYLSQHDTLNCRQFFWTILTPFNPNNHILKFLVYKPKPQRLYTVCTIFGISGIIPCNQKDNKKHPKINPDYILQTTLTTSHITKTPPETHTEPVLATFRCPEPNLSLKIFEASYALLALKANFPQKPLKNPKKKRKPENPCPPELVPRIVDDHLTSACRYPALNVEL